MELQTSVVIPKESALFLAGQELIASAAKYWATYQKQNYGPSAVVWLETSSGALILFTRAEYKKDLMQIVDPMSNEPPKDHLFEQ